ncbi:MAG: EamA family transporter [Ktedonobacteraceae bacterium]|nr:EamA family transporter [Ktedonobacteraceae bacterium]
MSDASSRTSQARRFDGRAALSLTITLLFWASAFAGIRAGLQGYSAGALVLFRFLIASAALLIYALITHMRLPDLRDLPAMFLLGLIGITGYQVSLTFGELSVSAGTASFLVASVPCFTALLALFFLKERLSVWGWLGIIISFLGVALISSGSGGGFSFTPGALLVLLASLSESFYFIAQKRYMRKYNALQLAAYTMWTGTFFTLVFTPEMIQQIPLAPLPSTLSIVYLGIFPAAIAYVTWAFTLSRMPASIATSFLNISPVLALLISLVWLNEIPTWLELGGGLVVIIGVLIVNTRGKIPVAAPPQTRGEPDITTHPVSTGGQNTSLNAQQ